MTHIFITRPGHPLRRPALEIEIRLELVKVSLATSFDLYFYEETEHSAMEDY